MTDLFKLILGILASRFKARATLEAENLILRQQVNVLRRRTPKRPHLNNTDRFLFVWLYRWFPYVLEAVAIVRPETIIRWHRAGFLMAFLVFIVEAKTVIIKKGDHDRDIDHDRRSVVID